MSATHVTVTIRNPAEPDRSWEGLFLVDTGATDSLVPRPHLEAIGLKPKGQRVYELADGREIKMDITVGQIEFMGEFVGGTIYSETPTPSHFSASPPWRRWVLKLIRTPSVSGDCSPSASSTLCAMNPRREVR